MTEVNDSLSHFDFPVNTVWNNYTSSVIYIVTRILWFYMYFVYSACSYNAVLFFRTIFTRSDRHTYVDPDYALNEEEGLVKNSHRDSYIAMLREMRQNRLNKIKSKWVKKKRHGLS
jgi:hypothetical protein